MNIFKYVSLWSILLPAIAIIFLFRKLNRDSIIIGIVVLGGIVPQLLNIILNQGETFMNITYNLYTPFEFTCYTFLFQYKFIVPKFKGVVWLTVAFFIISSLFLIFFYGITSKFLNQWVILNNVIQLFWAGLYLTQVYSLDDLSFDFNSPFVWFLIAIICYDSCTTVFYGLWHIVESKTFKQYNFVCIIHHIFNTLLYLFFFIGILKNRKSSNE